MRKSALCGYGGIGRRARFRFWWETVQVQVLLSAEPLKIGCFRKILWRNPKDFLCFDSNFDSNMCIGYNCV